MFSCFSCDSQGTAPAKRSFIAPGGPKTHGSTAGVLSSSTSVGGGLQHPAAVAFRSGNIGITFSGAGFLLPYFIGVTEVLQHLRVLRPGRSTPVAGSSAGSLVAVSIACGLSMTQMYDSFLDTVRDCRTNGSYRRLDVVLRRWLDSTLPPDAAERCSGVATVAITRLFPRPRAETISTFTSREDLIAALMTSCHIPAYFNGELTANFRGKTAIDGGVTSLMPRPTAPHDFLLKVCCLPRAQVARLPIFNRRRMLEDLHLGITPDAFGAWPYGLKDMLTAALHPHSDDFIQTLLEAGRHDATHWAHATGLAPPGLPLPPRPPMPPLVLGARAGPATA
ncbi:hypothetical protein Agub_g6891, partial [Astrephomene gubernaculifera]